MKDERRPPAPSLAGPLGPTTLSPVGLRGHGRCFGGHELPCPGPGPVADWRARDGLVAAFLLLLRWNMSRRFLDPGIPDHLFVLVYPSGNYAGPFDPAEGVWL